MPDSHIYYQTSNYENSCELEQRNLRHYPEHTDQTSYKKVLLYILLHLCISITIYIYLSNNLGNYCSSLYLFDLLSLFCSHRFFIDEITIRNRNYSLLLSILTGTWSKLKRVSFIQGSAYNMTNQSVYLTTRKS